MAVHPLSPATPRELLATRLLEIVPALKRRLQAAVPDDLRSDLSRTTPHQLESLNWLQHLGAGAAGISMNELARRQGCALSSATALTDRLIRQGLAQRIPDPNDRRVVRVAPTEQGLQLWTRFAEARREITLQALAPLDDAEVETLITLLNKLAGADDAAAQSEEAACG